MTASFRSRKSVEMKNGAGFTLMELTVGMVILGICATFTIQPIVSVFEVLMSSSDARGLCDEGTSALRRMVAEMKEAEEVSLVSETDVSVVKSHPASDGYREVRFYLDGLVLYRKGEPDGENAVLAQNVENLAILYNEGGKNLVKISLEMTAAGGEEFQMETYLYPMNLTGVVSKNFFNADEGSGDWELVIEEN
jgi:prepilin-type N-terminal cleavage/methylation domain-containing protein